jgi:hypothetical protein
MKFYFGKRGLGWRLWGIIGKDDTWFFGFSVAQRFSPDGHQGYGTLGE